MRRLIRLIVKWFERYKKQKEWDAFFKSGGYRIKKEKEAKLVRSGGMIR